MDQPPSYDEAIGGSLQHDAPQIGATVVPCSNFNVKCDVKMLHAALADGNKDILIEILCHRSKHQRTEIACIYRSVYGISLPRAIKNKISSSSNFALLMCGLTMPLAEYMARVIHNSHSYRWMCYIMFLLPNNLRHEMRKYFKTKYGSDLIKFIKSRIHSNNDHPDKFIITQIVRPTESIRDESVIITKCELMDDVNLMVNLRKDKIDKEMAKYIFYTKTFQHIKALCIEYQKRTNGNTIQNLIDKTFVQNKFMLMNIVGYALNPVTYFVAVLRRSMKGLGTNSKLLSATIVMRCEIDMADVKVEFKKISGDTLRNWIRDDTSGYYKYALYELIGEKRKFATARRI